MRLLGLRYRFARVQGLALKREQKRLKRQYGVGLFFLPFCDTQQCKIQAWCFGHCRQMITRATAKTTSTITTTTTSAANDTIPNPSRVGLEVRLGTTRVRECVGIWTRIDGEFWFKTNTSTYPSLALTEPLPVRGAPAAMGHPRHHTSSKETPAGGSGSERPWVPGFGFRISLNSKVPPAQGLGSLRVWDLVEGLEFRV